MTSQQPDSLSCFSILLWNFYLALMLSSCHASPTVCTVCPGYHHRTGRRRTSGRGEELIHEVCGPSRGRSPFTNSHSLHLFYPLSIRFYGKHLHSRYPKQRLLRQHSQLNLSLWSISTSQLFWHPGRKAFRLRTVLWMATDFFKKRPYLVFQWPFDVI